MVPRLYKIIPLVILLAALVPLAAFASGLTGGGTASRYERSLQFYNTHTQETLNVAYWSNGRYIPAALESINGLLRDHRNGHVHEINFELMNVLYNIKKELQHRHPGENIVFNIISGYRSPETNEMLRTSGGGQAKHSQHILGNAIDIRVPGVDTVELRNIAWCLQRGGVGYYQGSDFVHVDVAKVRFWNWHPKAGMCSRTNS